MNISHISHAFNLALIYYLLLRFAVKPHKRGTNPKKRRTLHGKEAGLIIGPFNSTDLSL